MGCGSRMESTEGTSPGFASGSPVTSGLGSQVGVWVRAGISWASAHCIRASQPSDRERRLVLETTQGLDGHGARV
jgi:hypothetical protein